MSENTRVVRDAAGEPIFYEGSLEDITAQVEAERALAQSRALYQVLLDNSRDGVFLIQRLSERWADGMRTLHGLHVLRRDIANHRENYTRFLVIAREAEPWDRRVPCKTSVMASTSNPPNIVYAIVNPAAMPMAMFTSQPPEAVAMI